MKSGGVEAVFFEGAAYGVVVSSGGSLVFANVASRAISAVYSTVLSAGAIVDQANANASAYLDGAGDLVISSGGAILDTIGLAAGHADFGFVTRVDAFGGTEFVVTSAQKNDFLGAGVSDFLIESTAGAVVTGEIGSSGAAGYTQVSVIGAEWRFDGSGDYVGDGKSQYLIEATNGAVDLGEVGSGGAATYTQVSAIGPEWSFVGSGDFLALGKDQFLIESTGGAVDVGTVGSSGQASYQQVGALGSEWSFKGAGDFYGDGKSQFLIESSSGAVDIGEIGVNPHALSQAVYTQVGALGSEWKFVGVGDYSGTGVSSFLIESSSGAVVTGTVVNGKAQYAQVGALGSEWTFRG